MKMNKQELIKKYEGEFPSIGMNLSTAIKFKELWVDILELDEPQKVQVPQFVADYIDFKKTYDFHVYGAMRAIEDHYDKRVSDWFYENNIETFVRAWLDGYDVEKEKRYLVKIKGVDSCFECLYYGMGSNTWSFRMKHESGYFRRSHTRKELEEAGFGGVFNSPLFEVEEAE